MLSFFKRPAKAAPVINDNQIDLSTRADVVLGDLIRDKVTGFTGIANVMSYEIDGTILVGIQPRDLDQIGQPQISLEFDIERIEIVSAGMAKVGPDTEALKASVKMGAEYRDRISGFVGICVNRIDFLGGCTRMTLRGKVDKDNKRPEPVMVAIESAELLDAVPAVAAELRKTNTGGPGKQEAAMMKRMMR